jgi:hypothetical protein
MVILAYIHFLMMFRHSIKCWQDTSTVGIDYDAFIPYFK